MLNKILRTIIGLPFVLVGFFGGLFLLPFHFLLEYFYTSLARGSWTTNDTCIAKEMFVDIATIPHRALKGIWKDEN